MYALQVRLADEDLAFGVHVPQLSSGDFHPDVDASWADNRSVCPTEFGCGSFLSELPPNVLYLIADRAILDPFQALLAHVSSSSAT